MDLTEQQVTPLFAAVINYAKEQKISFHTPGHKHGVSIPQEFINFVGEHIFDCDLTLLEEVDSLHDPRGVIKEAQRLAAHAYGADYAYFLVNGTSGGNQAMVLTACNPGDKIIVPRNAHQSVLAGIILSGAVPVYVVPEQDTKTGQWLNISVAAVRSAIAQHNDAKAVLVTSPTYAGVTANTKAIAQLAHAAGMLFLVDEAHGPHLHFHPDLPADAMSCDADLCVQSSHKIISSMTQASMLLARKTVDILRLKRVLNLLMTTSPSYILMASLDVARMQMATRGKELLDTTIALAQKARKKINAIDGLRCFGRELLNQEGADDLDPTKLVISFGALETTGYEVARILNQKFKIQVEFANSDTILLIVSVGNRIKDISRLIKALEQIVPAIHKRQNGYKISSFPMELPELVMSPREAVFSKTKAMAIDSAVGMISAETFSPYPPGIPVLNPGERLTKEIVHYLKDLYHQGNRIQGNSDVELKTIKVVDEN